MSAWATANKKFQANLFETIDPEFVFVNGVHVGGSTKNLERYFGTGIANVNESNKPGIIYGSSQSEAGFMVLIMYNSKGIITKISVSSIDWSGDFPVPTSEKAQSFITKIRRDMGIPENPEPF